MSDGPRGSRYAAASATSDRPLFDVVVPGTLFCDVVFSGLAGLPTRGSEIYARDLQVSPGGAATRAVAAARLGAATALAGVLGSDLFGDAVHAALIAEPGLDLRLVRRSADIPTAVTVALADDGDRTFVTHEDPRSHFTGWHTTAPRTRVAHVGLARGVPEWAHDLRRQGTVLFGGVGWDPSGTWSRELLAGLADIDVFVPNEAEAMAYTRTPDAVAAARALSRVVALVVVTRGPAGAIAIDSATGTEVVVGGLPTAAVDPTGAGDVFTAALMAGHLRPWSLRERLTFATLAGGLSVGRPGGASSAPTLAEVQALASSLRSSGGGVVGQADLGFLDAAGGPADDRTGDPAGLREGPR